MGEGMVGEREVKKAGDGEKVKPHRDRQEHMRD